MGPLLVRQPPDGDALSLGVDSVWGSWWAPLWAVWGTRDDLKEQNTFLQPRIAQMVSLNSFALIPSSHTAMRACAIDF